MLICSRYIEMNPVRAQMAPHPGEYRWSSYHCNALDEANLLISPHPVYQALGRTDSECQLNYRALYSSHILESEIDEIRAETNKAWVLRY